MPETRFRQIDVPSLGRRLSNVIAHPSSAARGDAGADLDEYRRLGGNGLNLHCEGEETESLRATGAWLSRTGLRAELFLTSQICHDQWDAAAQRPIDRFTPEAAREDVAAYLELLQTHHLDLVLLGDKPSAAIEPVVEAIGREIAAQRVRSFGLKSWSADRIAAAGACAARMGAPPVAAVLTTELSLAKATQPLWPEYVPFDAKLERTVRALGLAVLAHADDVNLGQSSSATRTPARGSDPNGCAASRETKG